jgi:hypothetical protein
MYNSQLWNWNNKLKHTHWAKQINSNTNPNPDREALPRRVYTIEEKKATLVLI